MRHFLVFRSSLDEYMLSFPHLEVLRIQVALPKVNARARCGLSNMYFSVCNFTCAFMLAQS